VGTWRFDVRHPAGPKYEGAGLGERSRISPDESALSDPGKPSTYGIVKVDTNAGKPSLTPLLFGEASVLFLVWCLDTGQFERLSTDRRKR
jgi:hypothetical protein